MQIDFENARNGSKTCRANGKYLHSKYSPESEAQKFAENLEADFEPAFVFIVEPALSYCAVFLRKRFPKAKVGAIRFLNGFSETDSLWDFSIKENADIALFDILGEEGICSSLFFDWIPSRNAFPKENGEIWQKIKKAVQKARSVLLTREYFSKRWLVNSCIFLSRIQKTARIIPDGNSPIVIAASGPSLATAIPVLKENRNNFFLIALSSACLPLLKNAIEPDLVISTDGGYWAKRHLDFLPKNVPLAIPLEAAVPARVFENQIIPLEYDDCSAFQKNAISAIGLRAETARRNGTVSGTALEFALNLSKGDVFFAGLDQESACGFQHCEPNALELLNSANDNFFKPKETRLTVSRFSSDGALEIYREWFSSRPENIAKRVFRLSFGRNFNHNLGKIRDIEKSEFIEKITGKSNKITIEPYKIIEINAQKRKQIVEKEFENSLNDISFSKEIFPLKTLLFFREKDEEKKQKIKSEIEIKKTEILGKMLRVFGK